jgi:hypothetical protein
MTALPVCLRVIPAIDPPRLRQQILAGEDRLRLLVLYAQGAVERLPGYAPQCDKVFTDTAADCFLARQGRVDIGAGNKASCQQ